MKSGRVLLLVIFCLLSIAFPAAAQALQTKSPLVAFVNSSGQLIISSADGSFRWIITNPGETLAGSYSWSSAGDRLFFAVNSGSNVSLRVAAVNPQSVSEVGHASGTLLSVSPDGKFLFAQQSDGSYSVQSLDGSATFAPPVTNDPGARYSGFWAGSLPLVAYWGYSGNSSLAVTDAATQKTITLDSGHSAPITPLLWLPGSARLIYRDTSGIVRSADLACLPNGCLADPLEVSTALASADADVATDGTWLYFRSGSSVDAVNLTCISANNCASSAVTLAANAAPQTALDVAGSTLVYTAYEQNPNDPNDREVRSLDLACLSNPSSCAPQTVLTAAVAGALSPDGQSVVVEIASGLQSLDLKGGAQVYLADHGAALSGAVWQP